MILALLCKLYAIAYGMIIAYGFYGMVIAVIGMA
jgi:hypothetical protein